MATDLAEPFEAVTDRTHLCLSSTKDPSKNASKNTNLLPTWLLALFRHDYLHTMRMLLLSLSLLFAVSGARADDVAEAKVAFATLVDYQKKDDIRTLDLFTQDCAVKFTVTDGKSTRAAVIPADVFREMLAKSIALKHGNKDVYEDVKYSQEGACVRVTSSVLYAETGKHGPFSALYVRDKGLFKIKELNVTLPDNAVPSE
ncbi:MAG: hypothetical protein JWL90_3616 [Chthoniobacteraceae bacterium]|nr:hypothetical protein [Chthoniobacteraceae bacterium]